VKRALLVAAAAAPGILLSGLGLLHPAGLTPATATMWWQLHVVLLPVFPLLGAALVFLLRGERGPLAWLARLCAYVYAVFYTGLDTLAGIGAGIAVAAEPGGSPVALGLIGVGNGLALVGVTGFLVGSLATGVILVRRSGVAAVPGAALLVGAAVVFLHSHIYWPVGGLAMLAAGFGCGLLEYARKSVDQRAGITEHHGP
jgi:hypothetical protein